MRHNVRCWQFCVTLNIIILWVEQHEETDYFFNVPIGSRAGSNGVGSVGAADAVAEREDSSDYGECGESSAYADLFGHSNDEGAIIL